MLKVTDDNGQRPAPRGGRRLAFGLLCLLTLTASALRFPVCETLAAPDNPVKPNVEEVRPFDLSLLGQGEDNEADGVFGVRPAAILKRPGTEPALKVLNTQMDAFLKEFKTDGPGIHLEDVEQVMGRVHFIGENKSGKRSVVCSFNVLRTNKDIDWVKLRDQLGPILKQHPWQGETYVSCKLPAFLAGITGAKGDACLWAADARTLLIDSEAAIKARIEAKKGKTKPAAPAYAAGWEVVSRGLFAVALDNRGGRIIERTVTQEELKDALADPTKPEFHYARFWQHASQLVVGCAGDDDFRLDVWATAEKRDGAAALARDGEAVATATKKALAKEAKDAEAPNAVQLAAFAFARKLVVSTVVKRDGNVVTVHAEVGSGLNALLGGYLQTLDAAEGMK